MAGASFILFAAGGGSVGFTPEPDLPGNALTLRGQGLTWRGELLTWR